MATWLAAMRERSAVVHIVDVFPHTQNWLFSTQSRHAGEAEDWRVRVETAPVAVVAVAGHSKCIRICKSLNL